MKDYHAADHDLQAAYLRDLQQYVETAERRDTMFRTSDWQDCADARRRRKNVIAYGIGLGVGIMLGVIAAVLFLP